MVYKLDRQFIESGKSNYDKLLDSWVDAFSPHGYIHMRRYFNKNLVGMELEEGEVGDD